MATKYGTIPTIASASPSASSSSVAFVSHAKQQIKSGLGYRRPWKEMMLSFSLPISFANSISRIKTNVIHFQMNYVIIILFVLFLSLLWHPISLIVFVILMAAWLFLHFLRDDPLVIFNYVVDDRVILVILSIFTTVVLMVTATVNVVAGLVAGAAVVAGHGVFRDTSNLVVDDQERGGEGGTRVDMQETASSSFSSSL